MEKMENTSSEARKMTAGRSNGEKRRDNTMHRKRPTTVPESSNKKKTKPDQDSSIRTPVEGANRYGLAVGPNVRIPVGTSSGSRVAVAEACAARTRLCSRQTNDTASLEPVPVVRLTRLSGYQSAAATSQERPNNSVGNGTAETRTRSGTTPAPESNPVPTRNQRQLVEALELGETRREGITTRSEFYQRQLVEALELGETRREGITTRSEFDAGSGSSVGEAGQSPPGSARTRLLTYDQPVRNRDMSANYIREHQWVYRLREQILGFLRLNGRLMSRQPEPRTNRLSASEIGRLPSRLFDPSSSDDNGGDSSQTQCLICLADYEPRDRLRMLGSCVHVFHSACVDTWLENSASCPTCRTPVTIPRA